MKVTEVKLKDLKPSEYNPRAMTKKEASDLKKSLQEFGMVEPIVVNKAKGRENVIIGGHQRYYLLEDMGEDTIPVVYVDIPDLKREQELNLRLNKNLGHWEWDLLANFDTDLLVDVGFSDKHIDMLINMEIDIDDTIQEEEEHDVPEIRIVIDSKFEKMTDEVMEFLEKVFEKEEINVEVS